MGTKSTRSSGTQITQRGVNQGNVLVDPITGLPVDVIRDNAGVRRLAVDANLTADNITVTTDDLNPQDDHVAIGDPNNNNTIKVNNDGSIDVNCAIDANTDNIAIADATSGDKLKINPDGSINVVAATSTATTPNIFNVVVPLANTEVSQALPANTKKFSISVRDGTAKMRIAFTVGGSNTNYITIDRGVTYIEDSILLSSSNLYFQLNKAGQTVEILAWN